MHPLNPNDIFDFIDDLHAKKITYEVKNLGGNCLTIKYGIPGIRIEVDFTEDDCYFSYFTSSEEAISDFSILEKLTAEYWE